MKRALLRIVPLPALALALLVQGCSDQLGPQPDRLLGPESAVMARGGSDNSSGTAREKAPEARGINRHGGEFRLALTRATTGKRDTDRTWIGPAGGTLSVGGHRLVVPQGAVSEPTLFSMRLYDRIVEDDLTLLAVELTAAVRGSRPGAAVDVGSRGFAMPVRLYLNYSAVEGIESEDVTAATIVWLKPDGRVEEVELEGVDGSWVIGSLSHFSDYALGWP